jgi:hypothetical protein
VSVHGGRSISSSKVSKVRSNNAGGILMLNRACLVKIMGLLSQVTKYAAAVILVTPIQWGGERERENRERRTTHSAPITFCRV